MRLTNEDILHFLKVAYFGNSEDKYESASRRAYRDFCRTIRSQAFKAATLVEKESFRQEVTEYIREEIAKLTRNPDKSQNSFDVWHETVCLGIIERFSFGELHYGQAQKWINMTIKYLCVLCNDSLKDAWFFPFLHVPMDNIIINVAVEAGFIERPVVCWSRWNMNQYKGYQAALIAAIHNSKGENYPPLLWEFRNWKSDDEQG